MPTVFTPRTIPTTTLSGREPVGRKYLTTEAGEIITTEDGKWIIAIDYENTAFTGRTPILRGDSMPIIETGFWDDAGLWADSMNWNDSPLLGTPFTPRTQI